MDMVRDWVICIWKLSQKYNYKDVCVCVNNVSLSSGGVYIIQHCCCWEGRTPRLPQFLQVHRQCRGPPGSSHCFCFHKQPFIWPSSCYPSHFDSRGWSQCCHARSVYVPLRVVHASISLMPQQDPSVSQHQSAGSQSFDGLLCVPPCFLSAASASVVSMEGSHSLYSFINSYQMMFFTLFALLAGTAIVIIGGSHFSSLSLLLLSLL